MANIEAYFEVIYEIRGNQEDITRITIGVAWEEALNTKADSDVIVRVSFRLQGETVVISQRLPISKVVYEGGKYNLDLDGEYVIIGSYQESDITEMTADIYYILPD